MRRTNTGRTRKVTNYTDKDLKRARECLGGMSSHHLMHKRVAALIAQVREECAAACDEVAMKIPGGKEAAEKRCVGWDCADAIRALGK